ncbi:MAG: fasciclin domain-containing protein, partial [Chitinophagaceae bacterium]|nr:fasciclin domain-containing protein [Chitinophagaceae bacterium]
IKQKYTLFLVRNAAINAAGYFVDPTVSNNVNEQWRYIPPGGGAQLTGSSALVRLQRILNMHVVPGRDIASLSSNGVGMTNAGEFVSYGGNKAFTSGNRDVAATAAVLGTKTAANGTVYFIDKLLQFSEVSIGKHIELLGTPAASQYNSFWQYLKSSSIFTAATAEIAGVASGTFYTFFIPDNNAILAAVNAGLLPGTGVAPNKKPLFNPTSPIDKALVADFIYYHILNKKNIATDGQESGSFETLYKFPNGDPSTIFVNNTVPNVVTLNDMKNRTANITLAPSNVLSNRCTIHLINNYLRFN